MSYRHGGSRLRERTFDTEIGHIPYSIKSFNYKRRQLINLATCDALPLNIADICFVRELPCCEYNPVHFSSFQHEFE